MTETNPGDDFRVAAELADVASWVRDAEANPSAAFVAILPHLSSYEKDDLIGQLVVLCGYAMLKPSTMTTDEYLSRLIVLLRSQEYRREPLESDE
ncbi:hypothetical protein F1C58_04780 [Glaciihabitans sp. INWT7]|uniref:hypothetical protein n=1 Tax=Glaciihabitans sp. INWT7 TaxID=2596912 RepID=UPI0016235D78|nr:hypothetical protein [Glaciihabitans sp. INWT7]QNE46292.1 hypothetical protein F1C58_04780 [Glaciihabitans sp. INWT7]